MFEGNKSFLVCMEKYKLLKKKTTGFTAAMQEGIQDSSNRSLFQVCVDHTSAKTQGAHLDNHICAFMFEGAKNCVSECVIKWLKRAIIMWQHMTTGHAVLSFRSLAIPVRQ